MDEKRTSETKGKDAETDCSVCLQPILQPVKLPCDHVFCFLCVKGLIRQNNTCALCRKTIPKDYLNKPQFVRQTTPTLDNSYRWFYQGQSGWWQYDDRTHSEIEAAYQNNENECEVLIAGTLYTIDFSRNLQQQKHNPRCLRHIKRDLVTAPKKGVAGVYMRCDTVSPTDNCKATCSDSEGSCKPSAQTESNKRTEFVVVIPNNGISGLCLNLGNEGASSSKTSCENSCQPAEAGKETTNGNSLKPRRGKKRKVTNTLEFTEDVYKSFATTVVSKLKDMDKEQRLFSEKLINDTLFKGILGKLSEKSCITESL